MANPWLTDLSMEKIKTDCRTQVRESIDDSLWREYQELILAGVELPPIDVFWDGKFYILADGFHRFYAHREAKLPTIKARVHSGDKTDALWFAAGANRGHGKRMTTADKQWAARLLLLKFTKFADSRIANQIGCDHKTVAKVRSKMESAREIPKVTERVGTDGKSWSAPTPAPRAVEPESAPVVTTEEVCPNCGGDDLTTDEMGTFCNSCKDSEPVDADLNDLPEPAPKRIGVGVIKANEVIDVLKSIPKNDQLRARAWEIVRDWLDANDVANG